MKFRGVICFDENLNRSKKLNISQTLEESIRWNVPTTPFDPPMLLKPFIVSPYDVKKILLLLIIIINKTLLRQLAGIRESRNDRTSG